MVLNDGTQKFAHLYRGKLQGERTTVWLLQIGNNIEQHKSTKSEVFVVAGKREARKIAKAHNATPWNF